MGSRVGYWGRGECEHRCKAAHLSCSGKTRHLPDPHCLRHCREGEAAAVSHREGKAELSICDIFTAAGFVSLQDLFLWVLYSVFFLVNFLE